MLSAGCRVLSPATRQHSALSTQHFSHYYFFFGPLFVADLPVWGLWLPALAGVVALPLRLPSLPRLFVEAMRSFSPPPDDVQSSGR